MDEEKFLEITRKVMTDKTVVNIEIDIAQLWIITTALQAVTRHPQMSPDMKDRITHSAKQLENVIVELHPESEELLAMGWDESHDVIETHVCEHEKLMVFLNPISGGADLGCLDCGDYLAQWDGTGDAPDWVPDEIK